MSEPTSHGGSVLMHPRYFVQFSLCAWLSVVPTPHCTFVLVKRLKTEQKRVFASLFRLRVLNIQDEDEVVKSPRACHWKEHSVQKNRFQTGKPNRSTPGLTKPVSVLGQTGGLKPCSNTTLRNHITHQHCEVIKAQKNQNSEAGQTSMARDGSVFSTYKKKARNDPKTSSEFERYVNSDFVTHLHPKEFATFDVLASESAFSTSGRVLLIRRTRLTPASLEMCMCLKDHLDAKERKQDKCPLETPLDFEEDVFDDEGQQNEAIPLSDEKIALDANGSSEGTMSPGGPQYDYMMSNEAEDDY
nr:zinc finger BED domain-containing protein RICESLEEPER 2 [Tanacetum cinerariifolium]